MAYKTQVQEVTKTKVQKIHRNVLETEPAGAQNQEPKSRTGETDQNELTKEDGS